MNKHHLWPLENNVRKKNFENPLKKNHYKFSSNVVGYRKVFLLPGNAKYSLHLLKRVSQGCFWLRAYLKDFI